MMIPNPEPLSLCLCSDDFLPAATGVGTHLQRLSDALAQRGHRVTIITTRRPGEPAVEVWRGVTVHRAFTVELFGFYQALPSTSTIERILKDNAVTLIHHHYLSVMLKRVERVGRRLGLPQAYTYHMTVDHLTQPWPMRWLRPFLSRQIVDYCNRFDLIISPSPNLAERVRSDGVRTPIRHITNPVAFDVAEAVEPAPRPAGFMVLFAGRLDPEKNIPLLLEAFRLLLDAGQDAGLWIAGAGRQRERLETLCLNLGISERVNFLGFLDHGQLVRHYAACDVFVLPSLVETQGLVAMEAMHFSRPIIVTRAIVSASELVEEDQNGFIVDPGDPQELAARLLALAADPLLRERFGRVGKERSSTFSPEAVVHATEDAYRSLLPEVARPPPPS